MSLEEDARELLDTLRRGLHVESAFLALFRFIETSPNGRFGWLALGEDAVSGVDHAREVVQWREKLRYGIDQSIELSWCSEIAALNSALEAIVAVGEISPEVSKQLVIALLVLDDAFEGVHPAEVVSAGDGDGFARLRTRVRCQEPLFAGKGFQVYPKPRRLMPPEVRGQGRLTELLTNLTVIRQSPQLRVINGMAFTDSAPGPDGFKRIGIVPTIDSHQELVWKKEANRRYSVEESENHRMSVQDRVRRALDLLGDEGVELILMPELVSSPSLSALVEEELIARDRRGDPNPRLVLAGTSLVTDQRKVRNRATVLNAKGEVLWEQDKLHAYRFSVREQVDSGHPLGVDELVDRIEAIDVEPRTLYIVDLSPTQRMTVLTCEDFIQPEPHRTVIADIVATTILVPIMSGSRSGPDAGWIQDAAMNYVRHPGATSIVANSGTLLGKAREGWQFGHVVATPRIQGEWRALPNAEEPVAWLTELERPV